MNCEQLSNIARGLPVTPINTGYRYHDAQHTWSHHYVLPRVARIVAERRLGGRALDFGCGNGAMAGWLGEKGFEVVGIDPSESGVAEAKRAYPSLRFHQASSVDDLGFLGEFDLVTCIEVIEHCYDPRGLLWAIRGVLKPGGTVIVSTPYHGYLKNLALAVTGKMDGHFTALWNGGHIKFFSIETLSALLRETGFAISAFHRVGRVPPFAKSMIGIAERHDALDRPNLL